MTRLTIFLPVALFPVALLAGCGQPAPAASQDIESLDRDLAGANAAGGARDPASADALAGQIMVDPALVQSANAHAIRPPDRPSSGAVPPEEAAIDPVPTGAFPPAPTTRGDCPDCAARRGTLTIGALGERQRDARTATCAGSIGYSAGWATRLPDALPLYPGAVVREAAGSDAGGCRLRIVAFTTGAPPTKMVAFYHARARAAGYAAEVQNEAATAVVGGMRGEDAFVAYATPRPEGGSRVELIVNGG